MARKVRRTFILDPEAVERARNAVYWTPGMTLAELVTSALHEKVDRLENAQGSTFEHREAELQGGRPLQNMKKYMLRKPPDSG